MTLPMPDSTAVADLPAGYPAYLGYVDGGFATAGELVARFPAAHHVLLTVTGGTLGAAGIDCEPGNVNAATTRVWVQQKLARDPKSRPVIYASVEGDPNFGMGDVLAALYRNNVPLSSVRLLSAHYEWQVPDRGSVANRHICGPRTCGLIDIPMHGTQWTDQYPGVGISFVDMSVLRDDFFSHSSTETERIVRELPVVRLGDTGEDVRTVQALCCARTAKQLAVAIDGDFGPATEYAVTTIQQAHRLTVDGVVGPQTWPVLLGVAP